MHRTDRKRRIDDAVKIDDLSGGGFPHSHVVDLAERRELCGEQREEPANFQNACRIGIAAGQKVGRQRLDVGFDLDVGSELAPDRLFKPAGHIMGNGKRLRAVDFEVDRH